MTIFSRKQYIFIISLILIVGIIFRAWGINFGIPHWYHMEEPYYSNAAWNLACKGEADSSLLQSHTYLLAFFMGPLSGYTLCDQYNEAPTPLTGRIVTLITSFLSLVIIFFLGMSTYGLEAGLISAAFMTINFLHVRESHFGSPDVTSVMLISASMLSYVILMKRGGRLRFYLISALVTGLALNTRITAIFLVIPFFIAHYLLQAKSNKFSVPTLFKVVLSKEFLLFGFLTFLVYLLTNIQIFVDPLGFLSYWKSFLTLSSHVQYISDVLPPTIFYLRAIEWGSGILLSIIIIIGMIYKIVRRDNWSILFLSFVLPYFIIASSSKIYFSRYILPILPFLLILASTFLVDFMASNKRRIGLVIVLVVLSIQPIERIIDFDVLMTKEDTRELTEKWIESHIPKDGKLAIEWHVSPPPGYDVTVVGFYGLSESPLEYYINHDYDYLITSSFIQDVVLISPEEELKKQEFYTNLKENSLLVFEAKSYDGPNEPPYVMDESLGPIAYLDLFSRPGPTISIYRLTK